MHIMLDLETWGKRPGCDIRSIGACVFDPSTGFVPGDGAPALPSNQFYIACDNPVRPDARELFSDPNAVNADRQYMLGRDPDTVQWWSEQSAEAQGAFADAVDLSEALERFAHWYVSLCGYDTPVGRLWAHGPQFDISILEAAYHAVGLPVPWHYRAPRDTCTIMEAAGIDPHKGLDLFSTKPCAICDGKGKLPDYDCSDTGGRFVDCSECDGRGTVAMLHHHALDDAICQAKAVCAAYKVLRKIDTGMPQQRFDAPFEDARKQSSPELSSLAARVLNLGTTDNPAYNDMLIMAKRLAGSVLSQDETPQP